MTTANPLFLYPEFGELNQVQSLLEKIPYDPEAPTCSAVKTPLPSAEHTNYNQFKHWAVVVIDRSLQEKVNTRTETNEALTNELKAFYLEKQAKPRKSSPLALLKHAGKWAGDDLDECLKKVYATRGKVKF